MTNKEKQLRKERIKGYLFKTLHIICYVLSIAFIGLMVFTGVQSCSKRDTSHINNEVVKHSLAKRSAIEQENDYILTPLYSENDNITINLTKQAEILSSFGKEPNTNIGSRQQLVINLDENGYIYTGTTFYSGHLACYIGTMQPDDDVNWYWRFEALAIDKVDTWYYGIYKETQMANAYADYTANNIDLVRYYVTSDIIEQYSWLSYFFEINQPTQFEFNKVFNYNAPANYSTSAQYFLTDRENTNWQPYNHITEGWHFARVLNTGYFTSNNQVFNAIVWECDRTIEGSHTANLVAPDDPLNAYYIIPDNNNTYYALFYLNTITNEQVLVNYRNTQTGYSSSFSLPFSAYDKSSTWVNDEYRYITLLGNLTAELKDSIYSFNNNNQNAYGMSQDSDTSNVFTLISSAFTGLLPILNMTILPYITIGTLLFIPLVAMLVFAIIRIIKK